MPANGNQFIVTLVRNLLFFKLNYKIKLVVDHRLSLSVKTRFNLI